MFRALRRSLRFLVPRWIEDRLEERRLESQIRAVNKRFADERATDESHAEYLDSEWREEIKPLYDQLGYSVTRRLVAEAERRGLPVPQDASSWIEPDEWANHGRYLTKEARTSLKRAIRDDFRQGVTWWFGLLIGLIGALTGLISVYKD